MRILICIRGEKSPLWEDFRRTLMQKLNPNPDRVLAVEIDSDEFWDHDPANRKAMQGSIKNRMKRLGIGTTDEKFIVLYVPDPSSLNISSVVNSYQNSGDVLQVRVVDVEKNMNEEKKILFRSKFLDTQIIPHKYWTVTTDEDVPLVVNEITSRGDEYVFEGRHEQGD